MRFSEITFSIYEKHSNFCSWVKADWSDCPAKNTVIACHNATVSHLYGSAAGHIQVITLLDIHTHRERTKTWTDLLKLEYI